MNLVHFDPRNPNPAQQVLLELFKHGFPDYPPQQISETIREIRDMVPLDSLTFQLLSNIHFHDALVSINERDDIPAPGCTAAYIPGGKNPDAEGVGSECDNPADHLGPHEGPDPFGDPNKRVQWEGGGFAGGDPLPYRNVQYLTLLPKDS